MRSLPKMASIDNVCIWQICHERDRRVGKLSSGLLHKYWLECRCKLLECAPQRQSNSHLFMLPTLVHACLTLNLQGVSSRTRSPLILDHPDPSHLGSAESSASVSPPFVNGIDDPASWRLSEPPNVKAMGHLVFETVHSLLQHWPNTRTRNGHTIVPGSIPAGTLLYHGTNSGALPTTPEWVSTDPEHSIFFCGGATYEGCWHVTFATTRPLKVLYFDGSSAAKMPSGTMDTQDIVAWGEVRPEWSSREWERVVDLCAWGAESGVDGYVRMEMDFEVMLCNFTKGVTVVSFSNIAKPGLPNGRHKFAPALPGGRELLTGMRKD
ncbi:hypothetical protein F5I97DRAFT_131649 [Phlebopus sp. FC_14]|nr:hypothetical protein F5I97DRAFT_377669 [Phlebopus sp. FC_14]KAH7882808.1 hypothetical protein F5I97DRAFT_131649 [Phlebopus sp. FC_14]